MRRLQWSFQTCRSSCADDRSERLLSEHRRGALRLTSAVVDIRYIPQTHVDKERKAFHYRTIRVSFSVVAFRNSPPLIYASYISYKLVAPVTNSSCPVSHLLALIKPAARELYLRRRGYHRLLVGSEIHIRPVDSSWSVRSPLVYSMGETWSKVDRLKMISEIYAAHLTTIREPTSRLT